MSQPTEDRLKSEQRLKRAKTCKHFNGVQNDKCKAGIAYDNVRVQGQGLPCLPIYQGKACAECTSREFPSDADLDAEEERWKASTARLIKAMDAIRLDAKGRKGVSAVITCPCCGKRLRYSIANSNGHVHAACETKDCVAFMQ